MSDRRVFRWATTSARLLAGTLVAAAFVIGVVTAVSVPWPTVAREPIAVEATPAPSASVLVCDRGPPGPRSRTRGRRTHRDRGPADRHERRRAGRTRSDHAACSHRPPLTAPRRRRPWSRSRTTAHGRMSPHRGPPRSRPRTCAVSPHRPAARPLMESWLVGGSAATGASDVVLLANPGTVPASVQLTVFGAAGPQVPAGGSELVVAPGAQIVVPLAGLVLGEESPVIRVTAIGAPGAGRAAGEHHPHPAPGRRRPGRRDRRAGSRSGDPRRHGHAEPGSGRRNAGGDRRAHALAERRHHRDDHRHADRRRRRCTRADDRPARGGSPHRGGAEWPGRRSVHRRGVGGGPRPRRRVADDRLR